MSQVDAARVLVVDDDATVAEIVTRYLEREGYIVDAVPDGLEALAHAESDPPNIVVLDLMLPGVDGLSVCRRLRERGPVPIIMLTAKGDEDDRVRGLELGADDYLTKPFSPKELTARVKSVLRRAGPAALSGEPRELVAGVLVVDVEARAVTRADEPVSLTAREFELLCFLLRHPRRAFSRAELLEHVWGYTYGDTSTVTVHVSRLREKVEDDPAAPHHIVTVWGVGYRFEP
jgi:two-component system response regulator ResD